MLRAVALAARLDFTIEPPHRRRDPDASPRDRAQLAAAAARGVLQDSARRLGGEDIPRLAEVGLLEPISAELHRGANEPLWRSLAALDAYRRRFESTPDTLTNAILLGSLLVPLGLALHAGGGRR